MRVRVAKTAGFCMGVRKAVEAALAAAREREQGEVIYTYGPLIHNNQVLEMLESRGVRCLDDVAAAAGVKVVIRAHGVPPQERLAIKARGCRVINATCPRVARVQGLIKKHARKGYQVIIVGDDNHAEVVGLKGFADGNAVVITSPEQVDSLPEMDKVLAVAQTTQDEQVFHEISDRLRRRYPGARIYNTICGSTHSRQEEVRQLCAEVEAMVVVGGKHSANTRRLAEIAAGSGIPTFHVETAAELDRERLRDFAEVAVTAGASTPNWLIRQVVHELESIQPRAAPWPARAASAGVRFLILSNLYVAGGAAGLYVAMSTISGWRPRLLEAVVAMLYVFGMHVLNRYTDKAAHLNDPARTAFYDRFKLGFAAAGIAAVAAALALSASFGLLPFAVLLGMTVFGLLYSIPVIPHRRGGAMGWGALKEIPASKTLFVAGAWSMVTAVLPELGRDWPPPLPSTLAAAAVAFGLVFTRSALFDLLDLQGDRLLGEESIPVVIGERATRKLLAATVAMVALILLLGPRLGLSPGFSFLMLLCCAYSAVYLVVYQRQYLRPDSMLFEGLVEGNFYLAGAMALIFNALAAG